MKKPRLEVGSQVKVRAWGGTVLLRRIVSVREDTVAVCCEEEYQAAKKEGRRPSAIGFKIRSVVSE
jgi:hypothetical protein